jgi:hypothetical protein
LVVKSFSTAKGSQIRAWDEILRISNAQMAGQTLLRTKRTGPLAETGVEIAFLVTGSAGGRKLNRFVAKPPCWDNLLRYEFRGNTLLGDLAGNVGPYFNRKAPSFSHPSNSSWMV